MIITFPGHGQTGQGTTWHSYFHVCYEGDLIVPVECLDTPWLSPAFKESALGEIHSNGDGPPTGFAQVFVADFDVQVLPWDGVTAVTLDVYTASTAVGDHHLLFGPQGSHVLTDHGEELARVGWS